MMSNSVQATYRILDANANRASEGLRTLEDYARFVLNHTELTNQLKSLRHRLMVAFGGIPREHLLSARDSSTDVGTRLETPQEYERPNLESVVSSAAVRTQQALRVIEEYGKTLTSALARDVEQIRYQCYEVTRQLELKMQEPSRRDRLAKSCLYALTATARSTEEFETRIRMMYAHGVDIIQLRDRKANDRTLLERASLAVGIAREMGGLFIVNDRCDLAVASDADGVHVGQEEMPASMARRIIGHDRLLGISTHDTQQVREAIDNGADYIGCGPVFPGNTKCFAQYVGPEFLTQVHNSTTNTPIPAFAIGGINANNVSQVTAAGFHRVAVSGAVRDTDDPGNAIEMLKQILLAASPDQ